MRSRPQYNLEQAKHLVEQGHYVLTRKVIDWLRNHGFDSNEAIEGVFGSLVTDGFHKADLLEKRPDTYADIYYADYDGERWYVKFFIEDDDDGEQVVPVWSCRIDGFPA